MVPGPEIALVLADDATVAAVGSWPLPREVIATAIDRLVAAGAKLIVVNLLLAESQASLPPATRALLEAAAIALPPEAAALRRRIEATLGAADPMRCWRRRSVQPAAWSRPMPSCSIPAQANATAAPGLGPRHGLPHPCRGQHRSRDVAAGAARSAASQPHRSRPPARPAGHVTLLLEADGSLRADLPAVPYHGDLYPSLAVETARLQLEVPRDHMVVQGDRGIAIGDRFVPTDASGRQLINHYGPAGTFPTFSMQDLLRGAIEPAALAGRIVLVGGSAAGAGDLFATPFMSRLPGSEFLATAIDNILTGRSLVRNDATRTVDAMAVLLLALAAALLRAGARPWSRC